MTPYPPHAAVDSLPILEELTTEALTAVIRGSYITLLLLALLKFRCRHSGLLVKVKSLAFAVAVGLAVDLRRLVGFCLLQQFLLFERMQARDQGRLALLNLDQADEVEIPILREPLRSSTSSWFRNHPNIHMCSKNQPSLAICRDVMPMCWRRRLLHMPRATAANRRER
jgi:hypothetical protein